MNRIFFAHGWGFDRHLWDDVCAQLCAVSRTEAVDFGFFGEPGAAKVGPGDTVIAVGHSLGALWWLTQAEVPWSKLFVVNGFPRFTECEGYAPAVAPRILARMQDRFMAEPDKVLADFRARCGAEGEIPAGADAARLSAGLRWLAEWDGRATLARRASDIHVLAGRQDPIVPAAMTQMAFAQLPGERIDWHDAAGHLLPLAAPADCARWITAWLD